MWISLGKRMKIVMTYPHFFKSSQIHLHTIFSDARNLAMTALYHSKEFWYTYGKLSDRRGRNASI